MQTNKNLYSVSREVNDDIKNIGYDYEGKVLKNSLSNYLLKNKNISEFVEYLEPMITEIIRFPKKLKAFWNYTIPKNYRKFN